MPLGLKEFLNNYSSAMSRGDAALFIGAGMSKNDGFVDWEELLRPYKRRLGLSVEEDLDPVAVAQYYLNSKNRERSFLSEDLIDKFDKPGDFKRPRHEMIARLPISTIWTTNYDTLIEYGFRKENKTLDVKLRDEDIGFSRKECAAILYKMHGDISQPDRVIISKEDYEGYPRTHPVFRNTLTADLSRKKFLFLGFSFNDPNLSYTLGHLRSLLENKKRGHYAVMRHARRKGKWNKDRTQFNYTEPRAKFQLRKKKQDLIVDDLQRYGLETLLVDDYEQVDEILEALEQGKTGVKDEVLMLPSEEEARARFDSLTTPDHIEKLKSIYKDIYKGISEVELADMVVDMEDMVTDVARLLVEKETGINVEHIDTNLN